MTHLKLLRLNLTSNAVLRPEIMIKLKRLPKQFLLIMS
jgi:hypothetical protein